MGVLCCRVVVIASRIKSVFSKEVKSSYFDFMTFFLPGKLFPKTLIIFYALQGTWNDLALSVSILPPK